MKIRYFKFPNKGGVELLHVTIYKTTKKNYSPNMYTAISHMLRTDMHHTTLDRPVFKFEVEDWIKSGNEITVDEFNNILSEFNKLRNETTNFFVKYNR